jgi:hypothetical protein
MNFYKKTNKAMERLSWNYNFLEWSQVPAEEKAEVYAEFCAEAPNTEDYFSSRWTGVTFSQMFSQIYRNGGIDYVDRDIIQNLMISLIVDVSLNADPILEKIFDENKPSKKQLDEAAAVERAELEA